MANPVEGERRTLAFSREEAWVVHAALLDGVRTAVEDGNSAEGYPELDALRAIEGGRERFDREEAGVIHGALKTYLGGAPKRDRAPGQAALRRTAGADAPDA
ncbi:hypothetical protein ACFQFH_14075 [Halobaculum halobium]|uniref:Uncharacterized protein n=1 Tax=Halobaculum halobium TaxID=3032281 RepID=A0ABD5THL4_9EURY|nr:hypothetical protein [Halobaculum sp. SYNS20]